MANKQLHRELAGKLKELIARFDPKQDGELITHMRRALPAIGGDNIYEAGRLVAYVAHRCGARKRLGSAKQAATDFRNRLAEIVGADPEKDWAPKNTEPLEAENESETSTADAGSEVQTDESSAANANDDAPAATPKRKSRSKKKVTKKTSTADAG